MRPAMMTPEQTGPDTRHGMILYMENVSVSFDGFKALNDLNLYIKEGELRCLIGANGAGKTTLMDVITGKTRPDTGTVSYGQQFNLLQHNEEQISRLGIGRKFQKPTVFEALSVKDNLYLSLKMDKGIWTSLWHNLSGEQKDDIDRILHTIGLTEHRDRPASVLSHGQKQWLEIGMLLAAKPKLLLVDEPVAGMTVSEAERTAELLTSLAGEHSVVVVEHDMGFVRSIARTVTVLHQGSVLAEGTMDAIQSDPEVKKVYLGEEGNA
ncbi:urea ABC transporter ATP-binding protein UrtD [Alteromonas confluentis]|uniref:Urea ABC transporter ATP-binding protein UrtD n=1 Tax=Alteromonas confluentis TaxID=1656094 RepID=A0A1E7ZA26_9ALTE|nr:urea ABC transporter ATP-binding protein UrtD [Alteromonas confluentis]OFC70385.1 urea ABC transporter ATP-binding protein UrtD [Alteromonas confluentis]